MEAKDLAPPPEFVPCQSPLLQTPEWLCFLSLGASQHLFEKQSMVDAELPGESGAAEASGQLCPGGGLALGIR